MFTRGAHRWDFRNNDSYVDTVSLALAGDPPQPREYERTYVLLSPSVTNTRAIEIFSKQWEQSHRTVGGSADDAFINHPFLKKRDVIAYEPQGWPGSDDFPPGKEGLEEFADKFYDFPGENGSIEYRDEPPTPNPWLLGQRDPAWKNVGFGDGSCTQTIGQSGCFITGLAMAQRFYNIKRDATPVTVDHALGDDGYLGCVANWRGEAKLYADVLELKISVGSQVDAAYHMDLGRCCLAELAPATREHFVLVYEDEEPGTYIALDPYPGDHGEARKFYLSEAQSWRIIEIAVPPVDQPSRVGLHVQRTAGDPTGYVVATGGPIKYLEGMENIIGVKRARPDAFCVWRQYVSEQPIANPNKDAMMRQYVDRFRDSMDHICAVLAADGFEPPFFGVESFNETYACWAGSIPDAIECDRAMIRALAGYPVAPVVFTAAVGNIQLPSEDPNGTAWPHLATLAYETQAAQGYFGYHNYWYANPNETGLLSSWPWLAGRWQGFDDYLTNERIHVNWFFGETGAVGGYANPGGGYHLEPNSGWKHKNCYNGNWSRYLSDLVMLDELIKSWNNSHGNRAVGGTIFTTTGGGYGWDSFEIGPAEMQSLAGALS